MGIEVLDVRVGVMTAGGCDVEEKDVWEDITGLVMNGNGTSSDEGSGEMERASVSSKYEGNSAHSDASSWVLPLLKAVRDSIPGSLGTLRSFRLGIPGSQVVLRLLWEEECIEMLSWIQKRVNVNILIERS